ncbi:lipase secretion chaperone [Dyella sp.]|jgi:lipase chaperone LimK|uniref:lipase secretion chaperone n=1 Tax=Dyella sp. TaxID=1869338 RepID=UPI002D77CA85|nr:lipase secretion chaperone [Dyella sp.]HET6433251.1 lipase secretion chaperone [Dyella sp.]
MWRVWLALAAVALGALAWLGRTPAIATAARQIEPVAASALAGAGGTVPRRPATVFPLPADPHRALRDGSLRGTAVDGGVTIGFAGRVAADPALRRLFDYYLSLLGETDLAGVRLLLREDLQRRPIDVPQQAAVMALFQRYVAYQQARTALAAADGSRDLPDRLAQDRALRERLLGPVLAQAFYPTADADDALLLRQLAHADAPDPDAADDHALATVASTVQAQTEQFAEAGLTPAQRHAERAAIWGPVAADRLAALDRQRAQWQQRLDAFAAEALSLQSDPSLTQAQRRVALQQLLDQRFDGPERLQAQAMWQAGLLQPAR